MFPKPYTIQRLPCTGTTTDGMGNDKPTFGAPVPLKVYGWSEHVEQKLEGHTDREIADVDLAMPRMPVNLLDRYILDSGKPFRAIRVRDRNHGFHGWRPGIVLELKRVTG